MKKTFLQYTIRGVSKRTDMVVRETALKSGQSMNEVALKALESGLGLGSEPVRYHDLDSLAGTWVDDPVYDEVRADMDRVDEEFWK